MYAIQTRIANARRNARKASGFTLVEILIVVIILGILAAIVIPQFTNASTDARKSNMTSQLQTIRSQVELYKLQHNDVPPTLTTNWNQLTMKTDIAGSTTPANGATTYGPYLPSAPVNPLTNSTTVAATASATTGWVVDTSGLMHGVNTAGAQSDDGN